jgi:hypothetical protein
MINPCKVAGSSETNPVDTRIPATAWVAVGSKRETKTSDLAWVEPDARYELVADPTEHGDCTGALKIGSA